MRKHFLYLVPFTVDCNLYRETLLKKPIYFCLREAYFNFLTANLVFRINIFLMISAMRT